MATAPLKEPTPGMIDHIQSVLLISSLDRWRNWGTERWSHFPQVPQLVSEWIWILVHPSPPNNPQFHSLNCCTWLEPCGFQTLLWLKPGTWTARPCPALLASQCSSDPHTSSEASLWNPRNSLRTSGLEDPWLFSSMFSLHVTSTAAWNGSINFPALGLP